MVQTIYHIGLPRTATTFMQKHVFPNLTGVRFLGKAHDNLHITGIVQGTSIDKAPAMVKTCLASLARDPETANRNLHAVFTSIVRAIRLANQKGSQEDRKRAIKAWQACLREAQRFWPEEDLLISDESLVVSHADFATLANGDTSIVFEQIAAAGLLRDAVVCVTIRTPIDFIRASYYKQVHQRLAYKQPPISFDHYVRVQLAIYLRYPAASRLFMAMSRRFIPHLNRYCGRVIVSRFEDLLKTEHPAGMLLGRSFANGERALSRSGTENATFSDEQVNAFLLSAPGVPKGITMQEYAETFPWTLKTHFLDKLLEDEQWTG